MLKLWDFKCCACNHIEEILVENCKDETQLCTKCKNKMIKIISPTISWINSPERTAQMMKKRSHEHTERCKTKGISLNDNDSGISSDPVWRNKLRKKNTDPNTIEKFSKLSEM